VAGGVATIGVTARDAAGLPIDLATATAAVSRTLPGPAQGWTVPLTQVAPGSYEGRMPADVGAYALRVSLKGEDVNLTDEGGWTWSGPAEARSFRGGLPLLAAVASAGGGVSSASPPAWLADASRPPRPLWPALLVLAGVLWPLDVASQLGIRLRRPGRARVAGQLAEVEGPP
jgi:hypothetical protein